MLIPILGIKENVAIYSAMESKKSRSVYQWALHMRLFLNLDATKYEIDSTYLHM